MPTGIVLVLAEAGDKGIAAVRHGEPRPERAAGSAHDHPFRGAEELHLWPPTSARRYEMGTRLGTLAHSRRGMVSGGKGRVGTHRISGLGDILHDEVSLHEVHGDGFLLGFGVRSRGR